MDADDFREVGRFPSGRLFPSTFIMHQLGRVVGVSFHIGGWPYGAPFRKRQAGTFLDQAEFAENTQ